MTKRPLPPTYFFVASLVLMAALAFAWPLAPFFAWPWRALGVIPIAAGVWLNLAADRAFRARGTTIRAFERSSALATDGVFACHETRCISGMLLILIGAAAILETRFIAVEEDAFGMFGDTWTTHRRKTRRWIA